MGWSETGKTEIHSNRILPEPEIHLIRIWPEPEYIQPVIDQPVRIDMSTCKSLEYGTI